MNIAAGDASNTPQDLLAEEAILQRLPLSGQASEGVHRQSRLVKVRAPASAIPWILASARVHQNIEWVRSWVVKVNPDAAAAFDFEWMNAKRVAQRKQGQKGHRPVQNKDACAWVFRLKRWRMTDRSWVKLGSSASRTASSEIAVIDDQRRAKAELLLVMLTAMGHYCRGRTAISPGCCVFSSFLLRGVQRLAPPMTVVLHLTAQEMRIWRGPMTDDTCPWRAAGVLHIEMEQPPP